MPSPRQRRLFASLASLAVFATAATPLLATRARADALTTRRIVVAHGETLAVFLRPASPAADSNALASGRVVVFLPSPIGSAFSMRLVATPLAEQGYASIVVDLLGHGMSSRPQGSNYSLTQQSRRLAAILDSLHVQHVLLVAQGTSATVALHLAANEPERVASILSLAGGPVDQSGTRGVRLALTFSALLDNPIGRALGRRKFRGAMRDQSYSDRWCTDSVMHEYLRPYERDLRGSLRALKAMSESVELVPIAARLSAVKAPFLLMLGDKKSGNAPTDEQVQLLKRTLPTFRVDTVARSGTMMSEERPDAVVAAIGALLRRPAAP